MCAPSLSHVQLLWDPDCSPPRSSVGGVFQARILEWAAISSSRGSSRPKDWAWISCISCTGRRFPYHWATWGACLKIGFIIIQGWWGQQIRRGLPLKRQFVTVLKRRDIHAIVGGTRVGEDAKEEREGNMGMSLYCGFSEKKHVRQRK